MRGKPRLIRGKVGAFLQSYADTVIKSVMNQRRVDEYHFRKSNCPDHVGARREAIRRLHADGFGITEIARLIRMSEKTVECHLRPDARARRDAARLKRHMEQQEASA